MTGKITEHALMALVTGCLLMFVSSCQPAGNRQTVDIQQPQSGYQRLDPAVIGRLQPGLDVQYFLDFFARDVRKLPTPEEEPGIAGQPILYLNHQFGSSEIFDSGQSKGVGMRLTGALHFSSGGQYTLQALANDGIEIFLAGKRIISDPGQHSDRLTEPATVAISEPGWYPLRLDYFQRKGTAALKLYWTTPGSSEMQIISAEAYGHLPNR